MTESVPHGIQVINTRWYWSSCLERETSMTDHWSGNVKDVEWWINTETKERGNV